MSLALVMNMFGHYTQHQHGFVLGLTGRIPAHVGNSPKMSIWTDWSCTDRSGWEEHTRTVFRDHSISVTASAFDSDQYAIAVQRTRLQQDNQSFLPHSSNWEKLNENVESQSKAGLYQHYLYCKDDRTTIFLFPSSFLNLILVTVDRFCHGCQHLEACSLFGCI